MIEIFILSLIQGITEFLPVSSSSHLIIFSKFIDFSEQSLSIDLSLHIGSFIAVLVYFKKDIINFLFGFVCGAILIYLMVQTSIQQMQIIIDKAYKLTVEMESRIQRDKADKGEDLMNKPKVDDRII